MRACFFLPKLLHSQSNSSSVLDDYDQMIRCSLKFTQELKSANVKIDRRLVEWEKTGAGTEPVVSLGEIFKFVDFEVVRGPMGADIAHENVGW